MIKNYSNILKLRNTFLSTSLVKEKIIKIIRKYFELNYNENIIYENWVGVTSLKMEE